MVIKNRDIVMEDNWDNQTRIIHCPIKKCKGMLMQNPLRHEEKCSDCSRFFIETNEFIEVRKKEEL